MSKTITIPKNNNPFIVNINNREYIYRGGETVEVPDEVAEVIEAHTEAQPTAKPQHAEVQQASDLSATGGSTKEWQKLLDVELTEETDVVTANVDVNGNAFEVSELFFRVSMPAKSDGTTSAYFRVGHGGRGHSYLCDQTKVLFLGAHLVIVDGAMHHINGCRSTTNEFAVSAAFPYGNYCDGAPLQGNKLTTITAGLTNNTLKMPVGTKIKVYGK